MASLFVFTITLENTRTGQVSPSMVVRKKTETEARAYAEDAIRNSPDLRVHSIASRPA